MEIDSNDIIARLKDKVGDLLLQVTILEAANAQLTKQLASTPTETDSPLQ